MFERGQQFNAIAVAHAEAVNAPAIAIVVLLVLHIQHAAEQADAFIVNEQITGSFIAHVRAKAVDNEAGFTAGFAFCGVFSEYFTVQLNASGRTCGFWVTAFAICGAG